MEIFNNTTKVVKDDLEKVIQPGSRLSIAAACFSMYAYQELKKQLHGVEELRFIFTSPTFVAEKTAHEKREFYIPQLNREKSLYGTEYEVKLRNELTQKAIAQECAAWIQKKVRFKTNSTQEGMVGFMNVHSPGAQVTYMPLNGFTTVDIGTARGNNAYSMINKFEAPFSMEYMRLFESIWNDDSKLHDVTQEVIHSISAVYQENPPELIYFMTLHNIFKEFLEDISDDVLPNEATGFKESLIWKKLYNFQKDAALAIINKLEQYNGCILADSVGLGKTFTALAVIKYYEGRNKNVLVLCPKKLKDNWMTYRGNLLNNPLAKDRLRYDVLFHTDLSRERGDSIIGLPLDRINWGNYDLVVIDESHNFRNGGQVSEGEDEKENRYLRLLNKVIRQGVHTRVLMLSATPVNNRFLDLRNQLALAYEGQASLLNEKLRTQSDIDTIFRMAQKQFNEWNKMPPEMRNTGNLLGRLDFDFFEMLDAVTIARSRKHIERYYDTSEIGTFPARNAPKSLRPSLTNLPGAINYHEIYEQLMELTLALYTPSNYILDSRQEKYRVLEGGKRQNLSQSGREKGIRRLMSINLLKRMESSVHSFRLTVQRIQASYVGTLKQLEGFRAGKNVTVEEALDAAEFDLDDQNLDVFNVGRKYQIDLRDMDLISYERDLRADLEVLQLLSLMIDDITPQYDLKLAQLFAEVKNKMEHPMNPGNRKLLIFTAFSDTAEYLYTHLSGYVKEHYGLNTALITGSIEGRTTIPRFAVEMNAILTCFSPLSKEKALVMPREEHVIDVLIATDCISEGQNLQDCDYLINYDIHWNPVRIIQRFGRIDRIGSRNATIQLVNFWPDISLDEYINLKNRVEARMRISVMASTGDDDYINQEEKGDLEYRRQQLERLQTSVSDLEEMTSSGISIMDLGLNEFRLDLLGYMKEHAGIERVPFGIHAVLRSEQAGVIFVLKNVNNRVNIRGQNRLHPFYMVHVGEDGAVLCNHLEPKAMLDQMRFLARGKNQPELAVCEEFNRWTRDGRDMGHVSELLEKAIASIIRVKEQSDVDSFFGTGQTTFLLGEIGGLDDFELICFMVLVK